MGEDAEIAVWWRKQCRKCKYRAETKSGTLTDGTCDYIVITRHSRGCEMQNCKRFEEGPRLTVRKSAYGQKKIIARKPPEMSNVKLSRRCPSKCACGEWLDDSLKNFNLKKFAKAAGFTYDRFNKRRKVPGAVLPDDLADKITKKLGVPLEDLRAAERRYKEEHDG